MPLTRTGRVAALFASLTFAAFLSPAASPFSAAAQVAGNSARTGRIIGAAEGMFKAMKARDYAGIWASLTEKSRRTIVDETHRAFVKGGVGTVTPDALGEDFRQGGTYAKSYWDAFLTRFDPDAVLKEGRWELDVISARSGEVRADIRITHRDSERPAVLQMSLEGGAWKVGLVETFWGRPD